MYPRSKRISIAKAHTHDPPSSPLYTHCIPLPQRTMTKCSCGRVANYGYRGSAASKCGICRDKKTMVNVVSRRCITTDCPKLAVSRVHPTDRGRKDYCAKCARAERERLLTRVPPLYSNGTPGGTTFSSWDQTVNPQAAAIRRYAASQRMPARGWGDPSNPGKVPHLDAQAPAGEGPEHPRQDGFYATYVPRGPYDHLVPDTSPMAIGGALMRGTCPFALRITRRHTERERSPHLLVFLFSFSSPSPAPSLKAIFCLLCIVLMC